MTVWSADDPGLEGKRPAVRRSRLPFPDKYGRPGSNARTALCAPTNLSFALCVIPDPTIKEELAKVGPLTDLLYSSRNTPADGWLFVGV